MKNLSAPLCAITLTAATLVTVSAQSHHHTKRYLDDGVSFPYPQPAKQQSFLKALTPEQRVIMAAKPAPLKAWRDDHFGVFIHWDHSSQAPVSMSWGRKGARPHHSSDGKVTKGLEEQKYNDLAKTFNPTKFNAAEWMDLIAASGAKYVVFTAKHHAGFCMWDSKVTDFDIMATPYGKDVTKQLVAEAHKRGIKFWFYYSQPDWHHPLYVDKSNHQKYLKEFMFPQIKELLTQYGKIDGIWFDGLGKGQETWNGVELITMMRTIQPDLLINHRWSNPSDRLGDFDGPERVIGRYQINRPWETCQVIGGLWGWGGDSQPLSQKDSIILLTKTVSRGGNLLLNTGPNAQGEILKAHADRYRKMGQWLKKYGESIYGTRGGPYIDGPWGGATHQGNTVYLHLYGDNNGTLTLPALPAKITDTSLITGGEVTATQDKSHLKLTLKPSPSNDANPVTIVKLTLDKPLPDTSAIPTIGAPVTLKATATSSSDKSEKFSAQSMQTGSATNFSEGITIKAAWIPGKDDNSPWIQLTFDQPETFQMINIAAGKWGKAFKKGLSYQVSALIGDTWKPIHKGTQLLVTNGIVLPTPITAKAIKVTFSSKQTLSINEIIAYGGM